MQTDKELAMRLVDCLEDYYRRSTLMETILEASNVPGWRQRFDQLLPDAEVKERVHQRFQPIRERILDAPDLTEAVREMLKDSPKTDL